MRLVFNGSHSYFSFLIALDRRCWAPHQHLECSMSCLYTFWVGASVSVFVSVFVDVADETQEAILFLRKTTMTLTSLVGNQTKVSSSPVEQVVWMLVSTK